MSVKLKLAQPADVWKAVTIESGSFEVCVRRPDFVTKLRAFVAGTDGIAGMVEDRIRGCIVDWRELFDEAGEPIPFTPENLSAACAASDEVLVQLVKISREACETLSESAEKNSDKPLPEPSTDAATVKT